MKNLKKQNKFKLESFEVAKIKNSYLINGGDTGTLTNSDKPNCPKKPQTNNPTNNPTDKPNPTIVIID